MFREFFSYILIKNWNFSTKLLVILRPSFLFLTRTELYCFNSFILYWWSYEVIKDLSWLRLFSIFYSGSRTEAYWGEAKRGSFWSRVSTRGHITNFSAPFVVEPKPYSHISSSHNCNFAKSTEGSSFSSPPPAQYFPCPQHCWATHKNSSSLFQIDFVIYLPKRHQRPNHTNEARVSVGVARISFCHTIISIRWVITLAGGMCFATALMPNFECSSIVELEPSLLSLMAPPFFASSSTCLPPFPGNFKSSALNSPSAAASDPTACCSVAECCSRREEEQRSPRLCPILGVALPLN